MMKHALLARLLHSEKFTRISRRADLKQYFRPPRHKPAVLLVDDDPAIAPLVIVALDRYGCSVESVLDGATALERMHSKVCDLAILDLGMPGMSGLDVLREMKRDPALRDIPTVVLTADDSEQALALSFGYGADDFVSKPFRTSDLAMRVYRLLQPLQVARG